MNKDTEEKYKVLKDFLKEQGKIAIAFSGGVDSAFLLKAACEANLEKVIAVTDCSPVTPKEEQDEARKFCKDLGVKQIEIDYNALSLPGFSENPPDRCYVCKKTLMSRIFEVAKEEGIDKVAEGSNMDDGGDYRPGMKAIAELGILSPLRTAGLYKDEIREISKELGLPTWSKHSTACLASRFSYGENITEEKLVMVGNAERYLRSLGFGQLRARLHPGNLLRIEVEEKEIDKVLADREAILKEMKKIGFSYVTLDLSGFHSGSMNIALSQASYISA